jgi:hypothetical protein
VAEREDIYDWLIPKQPLCPHCGARLKSEGHNRTESDGMLTYYAGCANCFAEFKVVRVPLPEGLPDPEDYDPHENWEVERIRAIER